MTQGTLGFSGDLGIQVNRGAKPVGMAWKLRNLPNYLRGYWKHQIAEKLGISHLYGELRAVVHKSNGQHVDYGVISTRVVTTAGANFLVDALQGTVEPEILRFHGIGTGTTAEAVGNTALVTELTTQYNPDGTRPTGTLAEGASANIFRTVATVTPDSGGTIAITEHGIFSQATVGGTLLDRSVFAAINLDTGVGDSITFTYELTVAAGG